LKSRKAVSIHAFSQIAQAWFDFKFNHHGPDGLGQKPLTNILGNPAYTYPTFDKNSLNFYYPYAPEAASRDEISMNYFRGINYFLKQDENSTQDFIHPEWEAIRNGLSQIFALTIKNDYKALLAIPEAPVWTLNEDILSNGFLLGFDDVNLGKNAKLYHGTNWSDILPAQNASLIRFWYYLLSHGTIGAQGYTNEKAHTYFINPIQKEIAIQIVWNAYKNYMPIFGTIEEFRLATLKALKDKGYAEKSKEYVALYDSWAAVLDLPDFASTLKHEPADGVAIDPWAAKLGVEVEYPQYESNRVFEVSLNPNFKETSAPVYRFMSYAAPDMATGMTYGRINLEPNKTYYVHSHLYKSGGNAARASASCDNSDDPAFCQSLEGKEKWTATYSFTTTDKVVKGLKPIAGAQIAAWESPLSWSGTKGADGYQINIIDNTGKVEPQIVPIDQIYDPASPEVETKLALSANTKYTWTLAPRIRLGSNEGVKAITIPGVSYTIYESLSLAEKLAFPYTYGTTTEPITFKTDLPKVVLGTPADNSKLSMLDQQVTTKATNTPLGADFFTWTFFYNGENQNPQYSENHTEAKVTMSHINTLPYFEDKHVYSWTFTPKKKATPPFIPNQESGTTAAPFHFSVNAELIPAPEPINEECRTNKFDEVLKWNAVAGAEGYQYTLTNKTSNQVVKTESVENVTQSPAILGSHNLAKYGWVVSAGIKNVNGDWVWGPGSAESTYLVRTDAAQNLQPSNNVTVSFGNNKSVKFNWDAVPNVTNYHFHLWKTGGEDISSVDVGNVTEFTVSGLEFDKNLSWTVESINPADPNHESSCHNISNEATLKTPAEPKKVIPEIGFNLTLVDCDGLGICLPDIKYNVLVSDVNGNLVFSRNGLLSNFSGIPPNVGSPIVYPFQNQPYTINGNLHDPINGLYKVTITIASVDLNAPKTGTVLFDAKVMDIWNPTHNQGDAVQLEDAAQTKAILTKANTTIIIKFKYDASTNNIVIQ
ncbi:MAG: hypothetical protein ACKOWL_06385, partial [Sphingobacteriaceae bacterium]